VGGQDACTPARVTWVKAESGRTLGWKLIIAPEAAIAARPGGTAWAGIPLPPPFRQLLQDLLRGLLPGAFFGKALRLAGPLLAQPDLDGKGFRMLGSILGNNHVTDEGGNLSMKQLFILVALAAGSLSLAAQPYAYVANFGSNPGTISVIETVPPIPSLVHFAASTRCLR